MSLCNIINSKTDEIIDLQEKIGLYDTSVIHPLLKPYTEFKTVVYENALAEGDLFEIMIAQNKVIKYLHFVNELYGEDKYLKVSKPIGRGF